MNARRPALAAVAAAITAAAVAARSPAQLPAAVPASQPTITLNLADAQDVKALVDYVSDRAGLHVLYDDDLLKRKGTITVRSPDKLTVAGLPDFLNDVLRAKGLALVSDGTRAGWYRVVETTGGGGGGEPAAVPRGPTTIAVIPLRNAEGSRLAPQVKQLVGVGLGLGRASDATGGGFDVSFDGRTNQLIVVGPPEAVDQAKRLVGLVDVPVPAGKNDLQFYKLTNATAADVLDTIRDLEGRAGSTRPRPTVARPADVSSAANSGGGGGGPATGTQGIRQPGATNSTGGGPAGTGAANVTPPRPAFDAGPATTADVQPTAGPADAGKLGSESVTADSNTNTIIVRGGPDVQAFYAKLIRTLDKRRPQVMLEATVVTLDTAHNFTLGVEISAHSNGATRVLGFSQFGLSDVNVTTGALTPNGATGGNVAVIGTGVANAVVQALVTDTHARVQSSPRVLVNDNATGLLTSIAEQPFTSVNASTTVATTSFGGYADAGTTISLTPHISEGDYLQLEYSVELSNFTGVGDPATGSPPPRQRASVESTVTIPDGSTIVIGGLHQKTYNETVNAIPILGQIPVLRLLFSDRNTQADESALFVFLRPTILRDDEFADLKGLTEPDLKAAGLPGNYPASAPRVMR